MSAIRVASFNVRTGLAFDRHHVWWNRRHSLLTTIEDLNTDILGLQELTTFQRRWLEKRLVGVEFHGVRRSRWPLAEATPVAVRTAGTGLKVVSSRTRWFGATPDKHGSKTPGATHPRTATTVTVRPPGGPDIEITCLHLDQRSASRRTRSAAQLLNWVSGSGPRIVMGDFNAITGSECLRVLSNAGFRSVIPTSTQGTFHAFTATAHGAAIDHILVSGELDVIDGAVVERRDLEPLPSDHWPVAATLATKRDVTGS